ncbi:MAG: RNA polymerase sigma factor [Ktedonobacterales bacterium]
MIARGSMAQVIGLAPPGRRGAARGTARRWRAFTWAGWRLGDKPADSGAHLTAEPQAPAANGSDLSIGDTSPAADAERVALPPGDFDAFIREHQRAILNYLWRMTGDEQSAYDLTQEVFVRSWRHFDKLRGYSSPRAWLFRVATNLAISSIRARRPLSSVDLAPISPSSTVYSTTTASGASLAGNYLLVTTATTDSTTGSTSVTGQVYDTTTLPVR